MHGSRIQDLEQLTREAGLSGDLRIVQSAAVSAPVVLHLWHPIVVMPEAAARWSGARIRAVLLHELAHIKRNDLHTQSLAQLACAVYWFNPLIWFAAHQLRLERERACDDFVLLRGTNRADYATHLFEIARASSASTAAPFAMGLAVGRSHLERRLVAIVSPRTPRHSSTTLGRFIFALPTLFAALAAGALQITARAIQVPVAAIKVPVPAAQVPGSAARSLIGHTQMNMHSIALGPGAERNSQRGEFRWIAPMHEHQTVEVRLGRGSIQVLPSEDDTVRVQARADNPRQGEIQAVSTPTGVKFCDIVTTARDTRNYCEPRQDTARIREEQPTTEFVIYLPAGLHFAGSTVLGDIRAEHLNADSDLATIDGNITLVLAANQGADFKGNVIEGTIDSDFPLNENTPTSPFGETPPVKSPRIVHGIVGAGGPHLAAMVVNGKVRLLRRSTE
jgi:hypothetical protein